MVGLSVALEKDKSTSSVPLSIVERDWNNKYKGLC